MIFKRISSILSIVVAMLFASSCHDEYFNRLNLLESQIDTLQVICIRMNENINAVQRISAALQSNDMITKVTKLYDEDAMTVVGYKLSFKTASPITIYDGIQGQVPVIGTKYDMTEGKFFWTIQYDGGTVQYMMDASGNRIPANGSIIPFLKVVDDKWLVSYDEGKTFTELGQATGQNADVMFKSFNVSEDYVEIVLANDTKFTIPTQQAFEKYQAAAEKVNENLKALKALSGVLKNDLYTYLTKIEDVKDESGVVVGHKITLSNGSSFTINNFHNSCVPEITIVEDPADNMSYWSIKYDDSDPEWILTPDGSRVSASCGDFDYPVVGTAIDTISTSSNKGFFVWTMTVQDSTDYMKDETGNTILAIAKEKLFSNVVDRGGYLEIQMANSNIFKINKKYSVAVDSTSINIAVSDTVTINYNVCGAEFETVDLITQNGFKATADTAANTLTFISPESFDSSASQVVAFFKFNPTGQAATIVGVSFDFAKKEDKEEE